MSSDGAKKRKKEKKRSNTRILVIGYMWNFVKKKKKKGEKGYVSPSLSQNAVMSIK